MKKLTAKQRKDRGRLLDEWLSNKNELLTNWKNSLDAEINNNFDYSLESLKDLGVYLIDRFESPAELRDLRNSGEVFLINGYINEVFIRNIKGGDWSWLISEYLERSKVEYFYPFIVGMEGLFTINTYDTSLGSMIYSKDTNDLYSYFDNAQHVINEKLASRVVPMPGKGGYSYQHFLLLRDEEVSLTTVGAVLEPYFEKWDEDIKLSFYNEKHLLVDMGKDYYFHFSLDTSEGVIEESKDIAQNYKGEKDKEQIASCKSRIEFWGDEDTDGDYINDFMVILEQLQSNKDIMIFDFRNNVFFDEM